MDDILSGLNERQYEAVISTEGYLRVVAGAGTGKTKALTHRYAYLVKEGGIHPRNILCITFTNKAAGEMRRRVRQLVGDGFETALIATYHGFCARILRPDIDKLFYPQSFMILDTGDQVKILEEIYEELNLKLDHASFQTMIGRISAFKDDNKYVDLMVDPSHEITVGDETDIDRKIFKMYLKKTKKLFALDFDDLMYFSFRLFRDFPEIRNKWQEQLYYIQVDEFQDTTSREMRLINLLSEKHKNLFIVGDPDQTIYEWRGALIHLLVDFDKKYPSTQTVVLDCNYRSTPQILDVANSLIQRNKIRIDKNLYTKSPDGKPVIHLHAKDEKSEAVWIANEIKNYVENEGGKYNDCAILYRAAFLSRFIEDAFRENNVPYQIWGGIRFFDRMEVRDAIAYLRVVAYQDDISFARIINVPRRKMGKQRIQYLRECAEHENTSLYDALVAHSGDDALRGSGANKFIELVEYFRAAAETMQPSELLQQILSRSGYEKYIRENGDIDRLDNLAELHKTINNYEHAFGEHLSLGEYLQYAMLQTDENIREDDRDCVKLLTIHAAKGLEFPQVFIVGMSEGMFPSSRTIETRSTEGMEEERRLCFVAITRARERLYFTESEGFGLGGVTKLPSRFLFDIDRGLYERVGTVSQDLIDETHKRVDAVITAVTQRLTTGTRVEHSMFGDGEIQSVDETVGVYYVLFKNSNSVKPISFNYTFKNVYN